MSGLIVIKILYYALIYCVKINGGKIELQVRVVVDDKISNFCRELLQIFLLVHFKKD